MYVSLSLSLIVSECQCCQDITAARQAAQQAPVRSSTSATRDPATEASLRRRGVPLPDPNAELNMSQREEVRGPHCSLAAHLSRLLLCNVTLCRMGQIYSAIACHCLSLSVIVCHCLWLSCFTFACHRQVGVKLCMRSTAWSTS